MSASDRRDLFRRTETMGGMMSAAGLEHVNFGPFRLSVRERTLSTVDGPVPLPSRAFDVLMTLIESRDEVVSKDELMRRVWSNVVVEENNLHVQIAATRRALGEHAGYIKTIPGRGYRFIADLEPAEHDARRAERPPVAATNLPAQVTAMIGRAAELAATCALLEQARLVTLVGPGGVGKTRIALAAAHAIGHRFPAGAWLVELGQVVVGQVVEAVAASLRIEELRRRPLLESTAAALRQEPQLLVLDGCEHLGGEVAELVAALLRDCPDLRIMCTSQAPLGAAGEHVRRIAPLAIPDESVDLAAALQFDAVGLFVARVAAGDERFQLTDATVASVIKICRGLDGLPFAIELAAARVPLLGLEPVRLRLANRLALLGEEPAGNPARHRTLRAAIEWSCNLLAEPDRQILRRLAVFAGGFTLAAAQEVAAGAGFAEADIVQGVGNLVRRSLLTTGPDLVRPRHRMLEALRDFVLELPVDQAEPAARRHAAYFCRLAEAGEDVWETTDAREWLPPFTAELDNFRAALTWALSPAGDPALAARLAAATARIWFEGGHLSEGRGWLSRALAQAPAGLDPVILIRLHRGLAELNMDSAPLAATAAAREAVALAAGAAPATEGVCQRMLAAALCCLGRNEEAERAARRAVILLQATDNARSLGKALSDLGILRGIQGDHDAARRYNREAQIRLKALGDDRGTAICLQYAAEFEFAAGETGRANVLAEEAVALLRALNSRFHLEIGLGNLAAYCLAADNPARARDAAVEALRIAGEIEDQLGVVIAIEHLALAAALSGAVETAARLHGYVEAARAALNAERQGTEQAIADRLTVVLRNALPVSRLHQLAEEGAVLPAKAARILALATPADGIWQ
jgi:predicted ATPase/DNA-binding winged helix-turn-helix (wHTH) protein